MHHFSLAPRLRGEGLGGLNDFLYKVTKRHIPGFGMWRLIVLAGRDNKTATFILHSARRG